MEILITDYLSQEEIKEIAQDEVRVQIREHFKNEENAKRLLSNLAYQIVQEEVNKIVPNYEQELVKKVASLISEKDLTFHVYNFDTYGGGKARSLGAKIIEQTVQENKELIRSKVVDAIQEKDYSEEALLKLEALSDNFASNIYDFVEMMKTKK
jgi:hypothetical protein